MMLPAVAVAVAATMLAASPSPSLPASLLVVAPHPDDEVLMAGGLMAAMRRDKRPVTVVIVTNGDLGCGRDGFVREDESIAALAKVGVDEDHVIFLGYPDGHLAALGAVPLGPVQRLDVDGACVDATTTRARRGRHRRDEHSDRTGAPGVFTSTSLVSDLVAVIGRSKPAAIVVTHDIDDHPDHAAVAVFLRQALEQRGRPAVVYRAIVHRGDCWPNGSEDHGPCASPPFQPTATMPLLPSPFGNYVPQLRVPTSLGLPGGSAQKLDVIAAYPSQTGPEPASDWLAAFARLDEPFFPVHLVRVKNGPLVRQADPHRPSLPDGATEPYRLVFHDGAAADVVVGRGASGSAVADVVDVVDVVGVVHVGARDAPEAHTWTLQADRRADDGGVVEVTIRRDGVFIGLVVDPTPAPARPTPR